MKNTSGKKVTQTIVNSDGMIELRKPKEKPFDFDFEGIIFKFTSTTEKKIVCGVEVTGATIYEYLDIYSGEFKNRRLNGHGQIDFKIRPWGLNWPEKINLTCQQGMFVDGEVAPNSSGVYYFEYLVD